jgi:hypothetical protein
VVSAAAGRGVAGRCLALHLLLSQGLHVQQDTRHT